ncbi:MAG: nitroreductase family deazaflavin-dependent oxidoreductase [Caldilineales bacterium]|nr:nitroreductase family deazaflavin-dependent oxidoreductase [Caldilineales bacterium]
MANSLSQFDETLRQVFKFFNRFMVLIFRLGLGRFGNQPETSQVMVLVHTGRKSGLQRRTPVNYTVVDGEIYCTAAYGATADWYRNILANPIVEVWLKDGWWSGVAEVIGDDDPQRMKWMRQVLIASGFAAPLFAGVNPKTASDEALAQLVGDYKLIRVHRTAERIGPGGPGDLVWVWPVIALVVAGVLLQQFVKKNSNQ